MLQRFDVLGVAVSSIDMAAAVRTVDEWIKTGTPNYVTVTGVHGVMESQRDPDVRKIHNEAGMVTPDGMPLVWLGRLSGHKNVRRVYGPDLMLAICERSVAAGYRHFLYGGSYGLPERLKAKLEARFAGLNVVGTYSPPFRPLTDEEDDHVVDMINDTKADIVWVGLSTPKQERWMAQHFGRLEASVMIGVGAAFDFNAGLKKRAPAWMQRNGLEWFFRLCSEPRRLWRRYLWANSFFLLLLAGRALGLRRYADIG